MEIDGLERRLVELETVVSSARFEQLEVLRELDVAQVAMADGARTLAEWVSSRLDISRETAAALVRTSRSIPDAPKVADALSGGEIGFERAVELCRFAAVGEPDPVGRGWWFDISGLRREVARRRRLSPIDEGVAFTDRFLAIQPDLTNALWRLWGQLPGADGRIVEQALTERADAFPPLPGGDRCSRGARQADALVSIAQDSLSGATGGSSRPLVSVFVDLKTAAESRGEAGVMVDAGPQVGVRALEEMLCTGSVELMGSARDGTPLNVGRRSRVVPEKLRRFVLHRDGGCAIEGCAGRYRVEAHHVVPYARGGRTDADNLAALCWFHHHVVIHGLGYRLDPTRPPGRLRFLRQTGSDPPGRSICPWLPEDPANR
jgi:hypothetical protein